MSYDNDPSQARWMRHLMRDPFKLLLKKVRAGEFITPAFFHKCTIPHEYHCFKRYHFRPNPFDQYMRKHKVPLRAPTAAQLHKLTLSALSRMAKNKSSAQSKSSSGGPIVNRPSSIDNSSPKASGLKSQAFYNSSASSASSVVNSPCHSVRSVVKHEQIANRPSSIVNSLPQTSGLKPKASRFDRRFINELTKESGLSQEEILNLPAESLVTLSNVIELCRLERFNEEFESKQLLTGPKKTYKDLIVTLHTCFNTDSKYNFWRDINPLKSFLRRQTLKTSKLKTNNFKLSSVSSVSSVVDPPCHSVHSVVKIEKSNPKLDNCKTFWPPVPDT